MGRDIGHGFEHPVSTLSSLILPPYCSQKWSLMAIIFVNVQLEIARACLDLFRSQTLWEDMVQQGQWPCTTLDDVPEVAQAYLT